MVEYNISLNSRQIDFISENYDALFFEDNGIWSLPEITLERLEEMKKYYESLNEYDVDYLREKFGVEECSNPVLNKFLRNSEIHDTKRKFDLSSRSTPLVRSLYGVIGFEKIYGYSNPYFHNFFVPKENWEATKEALDNGGAFSKEFPDEDLHILNTIFERNRELRASGINHRHPLFYISEISEKAEVSKEEARKSLYSLVGILGFCAEKEWKYWTQRWFVPKAREGLIEGLLV